MANKTPMKSVTKKVINTFLKLYPLLLLVIWTELHFLHVTCLVLLTELVVMVMTS
jgi:hypothetical protein